MAVSQNGWPVVAKSATTDLVVHGVHFPNGVLAGDVATVLGHVAEQVHTRVMPLHVGWCWGWNVKKIEGSSIYSNHASATAIDCDAPALPMGTPASKHMSAHQISECHAIERESGGVVRWGGDFSRPDPMHWEIVGSRAQVAAYAKKIRGGTPKPKTRTEQIVGELPTLKSGAKGAAVKRAQALANVTASGKDIKIDGDYGPATVAIIKTVQGTAKLTRDGVCGPNTWAALLGVK